STNVDVVLVSLFFFFSSRRRHTRCYRDWSSDVCSSDLLSAPDLRAALSARRSGAERVLESTPRRARRRERDARGVVWTGEECREIGRASCRGGGEVGGGAGGV